MPEQPELSVDEGTELVEQALERAFKYSGVRGLRLRHLEGGTVHVLLIGEPTVPLPNSVSGRLVVPITEGDIEEAKRKFRDFSWLSIGFARWGSDGPHMIGVAMHAFLGKAEEQKIRHVHGAGMSVRLVHEGGFWALEDSNSQWIE